MAVKKLSADWLRPNASVQSLTKLAKQKHPELYQHAADATQGAINALMKFGIGYICDYGDVNYVFRVEVDENKNAIAWVDYAEDSEGTRRLECQGEDAQLLTVAFAALHPDACFMYARKLNPSTPHPIMIYVTDDETSCDHLSTNSMKRFQDKGITKFTVACKIPTPDKKALK